MRNKMTSNVVGYSKSTRLQKNFISIKEHLLNKEIKEVLIKIAPEFITLTPIDQYNHLNIKQCAVFATGNKKIADDPNTRIYAREKAKDGTNWEIIWSPKYSYTKAIILLAANNIKENQQPLKSPYLNLLLNRLQQIK
jgi:hypothetical protein